MERVRFLGYVEDDVLPGIYANATILVLPSFDEGFGLSALEAMACGTPVIASNGGALPELIGDAGLIFDLSRPDTLASSMKNFLCDKHLRLRLQERGLERAKEFTWHGTAELIWNSLNEI
jgi:glycosyltransferase involved in cell wall biosynthesis